MSIRKKPAKKETDEADNAPKAKKARKSQLRMKEEDISTDDEGVNSLATKKEHDDTVAKKKSIDDAAKLKEETDDEGESAAGDLADPKDTNMKEVLVEFKFQSCKTYLVEDGQWKGKFNVTMIQNQTTGRFSLPKDGDDVEGVVMRDNFYPAYKFRGAQMMRGDEEKFPQTFEGRITGDSSKIKFSLGMDLVVEIDDDVEESIEPEGSKNPGGSVLRVVPFTNKRRGQLNNWVLHQGGMLVFSALANISGTINIDEDIEDEDDMTLEAIYKLKLYTVLSVHTPNKDPTKAGKGHQVDWAFLESVLIARFPQKDKAWARRGVYQYRLFLDLKIENEDWKSKKFSPSGPIDEIWHAHISFRERYQQDIFSLTNNQHLIEHTPVLQADSIKRYKAAYKSHLQKSKETGEPVDPGFWPDPNIITVEDSSDEMDNDDESSVDSDAHLDIGYAPSCG